MNQNAALKKTKKSSVIIDIFLIALITVFIWSTVMGSLGMTYSLIKIPEGANNVILSLLVLLGAYRLAYYILYPFRKSLKRKL